MPVLHPDHLYKMPRMNMAFALSSVALLLVLVWMVAADYVRDWKFFQAEFNNLDVQATQAAITAAEQEVDASRLEEINGELSAAATEIDSQISELESAQASIDEEQTALYAIDQNYRFAKAEIDAMKYKVEYARAHHESDLEEREQLYADAVEELELKRQTLLEQKEKMAGIEAGIGDITEKRDAAQSAYNDLYRQRDRLQRKLKKITPGWRGALLNAPMLDFIQPPMKVQQVILPNLKNDLNFLEIPRVDRCMTCHMGIDKKGFEDAPQPFTSHPNLELFVSDGSSHAMGSFGCTTCHYGHDRGTSFITAAHTPRDEEQEHEWHEKYGWHHLHHWDEPMLPMQFIEASCRKCHTEQIRVPGAQQINRSLMLTERFGCYGCHKIAGFEDLPKPGPDLRSLSSKLTPEWAMKWLKDPRGFRPTTRMPQFWDLDNSSTPELLERNNVEADAIIAVLYDKSNRSEYPPPPVKGDPARGEELVETVGCMACHHIGPDDPVVDRGSTRQFGPELNQMGSKVDAGWLYAWVRNPQSVSPTTRMPNLRLTEREASDVVAYLLSLRNGEFEGMSAPKPDPAVRDEIVLDYLGQKASAEEARASLVAMSEQDKRLFLGDKFINRYGCFGCHLIDGYENASPIGTELSQWASKYLDQLDYGLIAQHATEASTTMEFPGFGTVDKVPHTKYDWAFRKLQNTRIYDLGRVKKPEELLKMPLFGFSDEEAWDIVTGLLSYTKERMELEVLRTLSSEERDVEHGRRIVINRNCHACHPLHEDVLGEVGTVRQVVQKGLVKYDGRSPDDAEAIAETFSAPTLNGEGRKVKPDWFFAFLKNPTPIRPWLKLRMPTFGLSDEDANLVITHFARHDNAKYPFETYAPGPFGAVERAAALKMFGRAYFNCWSCHQQGDRKPPGPPDSWAPDLTMARERLRPEWIVDWLYDPQALQPGTRMPTFYDQDDPGSTAPQDVFGGDPHRQIRVIRDYIYSLGGGGAESRRAGN